MPKFFKFDDIIKYGNVFFSFKISTSKLEKLFFEIFGALLNINFLIL